MLKSNLLFGFVLALSLLQLKAQKSDYSVRQIGEDIQLIQLSENTFIHRSYKVDETYGRIASNGLVYIIDSLCLVFDTPVTLKTTTYLLDYLQESKGLKVQAVVVNHFHEDCLAGLDSVHARGIPSFGNKNTIKLALLDGVTAPQRKFGKKKIFKIGDQQAIAYYPGPAHTLDNTIAYLPSEKILFGGCMLKSQHAQKGNITDADTSKWSKTVIKVKKKFPEAATLIPGHGHHGGRELLDYTIELFAE